MISQNAEFVLWFIHLLCIYVVISQKCGIHLMVIYNCIFMIVYLCCDFTKMRNSFYGLFINCIFMIVFLWLCFYDVISQKCGIHFMVIYNCIFMIVFLWLCFYDVISQNCGFHFMVIYNCIFIIVYLWLYIYDCVFMMWFHKIADFI